MNLFKTHAPAAVTPVSGDPCPWSRPMRGACCGHVTPSPPMRARGVQLRGANYWQLLEAVFRLMTRPQQILSLVLQKVASEADPKVRNHGEGPY